VLTQSPPTRDTPLEHFFGDDFWSASDKLNLLKRHADAHEIADAVLFLISEQNSYITGQIFTHQRRNGFDLMGYAG
jgi:NAD(P)-dependent dehydrogenase (short-subunit alcohol dehydrogenase family)